MSAEPGGVTFQPCVPVGTGSIGVVGPNPAVCVILPPPVVCVIVQPPSISQVISLLGLVGAANTLSVAGASVEDLKWWIMDSLRGPEGPDFFSSLMGFGPAAMPGGVAAGRDIGFASQNGTDIYGEGSGDRVSRAGRGAVVGAFFNAYNRGLQPNVSAAVGPGGIPAESDAGGLGHKPWPFDPPIYDPPIYDPPIYEPGIVVCRVPKPPYEGSLGSDISVSYSGQQDFNTGRISNFSSFGIIGSGSSGSSSSSY